MAVLNGRQCYLQNLCTSLVILGYVQPAHLYPKIIPMGRLGSGQDSEMACFVVLFEPKI